MKRMNFADGAKLYQRGFLTLLILAFIGCAPPATAQQKLAAITDATHPEGDRTFMVKLRYGIDASRIGINEPRDLPVEVDWHGQKFPAQLRVTRLTYNVVKLKILWIAVENHYYYPNATLREIYIDRRIAGEPVRSLEGLDKVSLIPLQSLSASGTAPGLPSLDADMAKLNPHGQQTVVIEQSNLSQAYRAVVSLWNLSAAAVRKSKGEPKILPAERTELAFTFLGIEGRPDMEKEQPKTLPVQSHKSDH